MLKPFERIALTGRGNDPRTIQALQRVAEHLRPRCRTVTIDAEMGDCDSLPLTQLNKQSIAQDADLIIVVGGDGTLLNAARRFVDMQIPMMGINLGRLGFLNDISPSQLEMLDPILQGEYVEEPRMLLDVSVFVEERLVRRSYALNDAVLHKWNSARMIEFDLFVEGRLLNSHRSDGMIIATPTGSTAYALSSGGPIVHPALDSFLMVPICPHTLSNRPIMLSANSQIRIFVHPSSQPFSRISCDGQVDLEIEADTQAYIHISTLAHRLKLIHPANHDFFETLRAKLKWGESSYQGRPPHAD